MALAQPEIQDFTLNAKIQQHASNEKAGFGHIRLLILSFHLTQHFTMIFLLLTPSLLYVINVICGHVVWLL